MTGGDRLRSEHVWFSEHYWPGLAPELVLAQSQLLAMTGTAISALALPGQHSALGLWVGASEDAVRAVLARTGLGVGALSEGWLLTPQAQDAVARDSGVVHPAS